MNHLQVNRSLLFVIRIGMLVSLVLSQFAGAIQPVFAAGDPSTTTITADDPDPSSIGQDVAVSVIVSGGETTPTGTVEITGADSNCTITLENGIGSCSVNFASAGEKTLTATYGGDGVYDTSEDTESHTVAEPFVCTDAIGCVDIAPADPIHIAYALVVEGPDASLGIDARNGVEIAIDDAGGQILGHAIQFDGVDSGCSAEGGLAAGTTLATDPSIVAVIGTSCSSAAREAMPLISAAGFSMISPSNTAPDLTDPGNPNNHPGYLRVSHNDETQGAAAAQFAWQHLGITSAATITDGSPYSSSLVQAFVDEFVLLGGTVTTQETVEPGVTDVAALLNSMAGDGPQLIYLPVFMDAGTEIISQARLTSGLEGVYLLGADSLYLEDLVNTLGWDVEGFMVTSPDFTKFEPEYTNHFLPAYETKFGTAPTSVFHAHAYDAFNLAKSAIEDIAVVEPDGTIHIGRQALRDALYGTTDFPGLTGTLTCSSTGDCADPHIAAYRHHVDQFPPENIWPDFTPLSWSAPGCEAGNLIQSVEATGEHAVTFNLCRPDAAFLSRIAISSFAIYPQEWIEGTSEETRRSEWGLEHPVGTGPYKISDWQRGVALPLVNNPDYWGAAPEADNLVFTWSDDPDASLTALQNGTLDGYSNVVPGQYATIEADPNLQLVTRPALNTLYLGMTNTFEPFDDVLVRRAVAKAINRQYIIDTYYPAGSQVASHFTPCSIPNGCVGDAWYAYDPTEALADLTAAGFPTGFETHLYYRNVVRGYLPDPQAVAQEMHDQLLANLGINAILVEMDSAAFVQQAQAGQLDGFYLLGWAVDYPHVSNFLDFHFGQQNPQFGDPFPDIYNNLNTAAQYADPLDAEPYYTAANNAIRTWVPMVPIAHGGSKLAYRADVTNPQAGPVGNDFFALSDPGGRNTFNWSQAAEPVSLFCADESDGESFRACDQIMQPLYTFVNNSTDIEPALATSCTPNAELTVWTCTLREGVKFHNGSGFDANDVVSTFRMGLDASSPYHKGNSNIWNYYSFIWGAVNIPPANPYFQVRANDDRIEAMQWPLHAEVTLEIDDPGTPENPDYTITRTVFDSWTPWGSPESYVEFNLWDDFDIQPGFEVRLSDGTTTKTHTVTNLAFTGFDVDLDLVHGVAATDSRVDVWACDNENCWNRHVAADVNGEWTADFANLGIEDDEQDTFDLRNGTWVDSIQTDGDGDGTMYGEHIPNPNFSARFPENEVHGYDWPLGASVDILIDDLDPETTNFSDTQTVVEADWDPNQTWVRFELGNFSLAPGQVISMTDGVTTKTHTVTNLAVAAVDPDTDTVSGTADAYSYVEVGHLCDETGCAIRRIYADGESNWVADFSVPGAGDDEDEQRLFDIQPGTGNEARQPDEDGDSTTVQWNVPNPYFQVRANEERVETMQWPLGSMLTLTIDNSGTPEIDYTSDPTEVVDGTTPWGSDETYLGFDLNGVFDIQPGYEVSLSDGALTKTMTVSVLSFTNVDLDTDIVSGIASPGAYVELWICDDTSCDYRKSETANSETGLWQADFTGIYDIVLGTWIDSSEQDGTGNSTMYGITIEIPTCAPGDSVAGTVYYGDGVTPMDGATVHLDDYDTGEALFTTGVDPDGGYACYLPDGNYRIWADYSDINGFSREYYQETIYEDADLIIIEASTQMTGVDFTLETPMYGFQHLTFNMDDPLVSELAVRQAIAFGTNRLSIASAITPGALIPNSYMSPTYYAYPTIGLPIYNYDPVWARQILENAGWVDTDEDGIREKGGVRLHIDYNYRTNGDLNHPRSRIAPIFVADMAAIGIEIDAHDVDDLFGTPYGIVQFAWAGIDLNLDAPLDIQYAYYTGHNMNMGNYSNPAADALIDAAEAVGTRAEKLSYLQQHQVTVMTDLAVFPLVEYRSEGLSYPNFSARFPENEVHGYNWPLGDSVSILIDDLDPETENFSDTQTVVVADWDPNQTFVRFELGDFTLTPGQLISMSDGIFTKVHTVTNLAVTAVDPDADTVTGTAEADSYVEVGHLCDESGCAIRRIYANGEGTWVADFSAPGTGDDPDEQRLFDIVPGTGNEARQPDDDDDSTTMQWNVPDPHFQVRANTDELEIFQWPLGAELILEIDDPGTPELDYTSDPILVQQETTPWGSYETYVYLGLGEEFDIQPGFAVSLSDGTTAKMHTVTSLAFTDFDLDLDLVHGVAGADSWVNVWACDDTDCWNRHTRADGDGNWTVDFANPGTEPDEQHIFDLQPGSWVDSGQWDGDGDATLFGQNIPNPNIIARMLENQVEGYEWPLGASVDILIDDLDPETTNFSDTQTVALADWDPNQTYINFGLGDFSLAPGQVISMTDGVTIKTHLVTGLAVTSVNADEDTVSGTAEPDSYVEVGHLCDDSGCAIRRIYADAEGNWVADFSILGAGENQDEQRLFDITPGMENEARQPDEEWDSTAVYWYAGWTAPENVPLVYAINGGLSTNSLSTGSILALNQTLEPLFRTDPDGNPIPAAATGYSLSPDGLTYTITLRTDAQWSDSVPVTAQQFVDSVIHFLDSDNGYEMMYYPILNAQAFADGSITDPALVGIHATGTYTLEIELEQETVHFPQQVLAFTMFWPVRLDLGDGWEEQVSNGPYLISEHDGAHLLLSKNPSYHDADLVNFTQVAFSVIPNDTLRLAQYQNGDIDVATSLPLRVYADPDFSSDLYVAPLPGISYAGFNTQRGPTADPLVRAALASAVDRETILDSIFGATWKVPATSVIPPDLPGSQNGSVGYAYNPTQAQAYLSNAGYPSGTGFPEIVLIANYGQEGITEQIADNWRTVLGIPVRTEYYAWGVYLQMLNDCSADPASCDYNAYRIGWNIDYADAYNILNDLFNPDSENNHTGWDNATYRGLLDLVRTETDPVQRIMDIQAADEILVETDAVVIPLFYSDRPMLIRPDISPYFTNMATYLDKWSTLGDFGKVGPIDGETAVPTNPSLSWETSIGATAYKYCYYSLDDNVCDNELAWTDVGSNTSVMLSSLIRNTTYYWQVKAVNADSTRTADAGSWWSFTTKAGPTPVADFDGDGDTDISYYRPDTLRWYVLGQPSIAFGASGAIPVPADYDGDGDVDLAYYRPDTLRWYIAGQPSIAFGYSGAIPVPADYNGDGAAEIAYYRPDNNRWYVLGQPSVAYGVSGAIPVPADYNGDGAAEIAYYRPDNNRWYVLGKASVAYGTTGMIPVPADYDGDGDADIAYYNPANGRWYVVGRPSVALGLATDIPVPGDYDGDGAVDVAVYRPSEARWYFLSQPSVAFGASGAFPLPARDTNGDGDPYQ